MAAMRVEADRQRMLVRKAAQCEASLLIMSNALQRLLADQAFVDLLQSEDRAIPAMSLQHLKRVRAIRQIEMAELMIAASNYSAPYARALLAAIASDQMLAPETGKVSKLLKPEDAARMDKEIKLLKRELRLIEESYGRDMLNLVLARGYLTKLLRNDRVRRYLTAHHAELLAELEKVAVGNSG